MGYLSSNSKPDYSNKELYIIVSHPELLNLFDCNKLGKSLTSLDHADNYKEV